MKQIVLMACAACFAGTLFAQEASDDDVNGKYPGFHLAFQDEFDKGEVPDPEVWSYEIGMKRNHEDQCYTDKNATIKDGLLVIEARKERIKNPDYKKYASEWNKKKQYCDYTSASIIAKKPYQFTYGIYEVRAKIPVGTGYWPAIWSTGCTCEWPYNGEIDIMEYYGDAIHANVAWGSNQRWNATWNSNAPRMSEFEPDFGEKFHIWRMEWDEEAIRIYLDDRLLNETMLDKTVNPNPGESWYDRDGYNPYRDPENTQGMWLNLALGGDNGGKLDNTVFPAQYLVDYVRIYVPDDAYSSLNLQVKKAKELLDETVVGPEPWNYSENARKDLQDAIDKAVAKIGVIPEGEVADAVKELRDSISRYKENANGIADGSTYRLLHVSSGLYLSTGWKDDKNCVLLLSDNRNEEAGLAGYCQEFTFNATPEGASQDGFNISVGGGNYVYRDSWNLYVNDSPRLKTKNWIFDVEFENHYAKIKNFGTGKYFGNDDDVEWASMYSDKSGTGNRRALFELVDVNGTGIDGIYNNVNRALVKGVYNFQGMKIADSLEELEGRSRKSPLIVIEGGKARKICF